MLLTIMEGVLRGMPSSGTYAGMMINNDTSFSSAVKIILLKKNKYEKKLYKPSWPISMTYDLKQRIVSSNPDTDLCVFRKDILKFTTSFMEMDIIVRKPARDRDPIRSM